MPCACAQLIPNPERVRGKLRRRSMIKSGLPPGREVGKIDDFDTDFNDGPLPQEMHPFMNW